MRKGPVWLLVLAVAGCEADSGGGEGTLQVSIWGEDFIASGIPASEFADGWSVKFDRFLVSVGAISVAKQGQSPVLVDQGFRVWDLTRTPTPVTVATGKAPAGAYPRVAYTIAPAASATAGNTTQADVKAMTDAGLSVLVEGKATKGAKSIEFSWGFATATVYDPCQSTAAVQDGGTGTAQITIHGDHLFYDSAVSEDAVLRFEDVALADADGDGRVTEAELRAYKLAALPNYGVGSLHIEDMWAFIEHMTRTLGHIDGEGHCHTR